MAETRKTLGQSFPAAGVLSTHYTVPGATSIISSTITACNQASLSTKIRLSVAVGGAADTPAQYLLWDSVLEANETKAFTLGITAAATDVLRTYSANGQVSFNGFGVELT